MKHLSNTYLVTVQNSQDDSALPFYMSDSHEEKLRTNYAESRLAQMMKINESKS